MTCIAAVAHEGRVYVGGDSAGVSGWDLTLRADEKVFINRNFIFGFTTSFRMGQLLRYKLYVPDFSSFAGTLESFMATVFIDVVRACLREGGWAEKDKEQEKGGDFIVGTRGWLFTVHSDYQVAESIWGFSALGCGASFALGSLDSTISQPPQDRVKFALQTAERFSAGVRGPFKVVEL